MLKTDFFSVMYIILQAVIEALQQIGLPEAQHLICFVQLQL